MNTTQQEYYSAAPTEMQISTDLRQNNFDLQQQQVEAREALISPGIYRIKSSRRSGYVLAADPEDTSDMPALKFIQQTGAPNELFFIESFSTNFGTSYSMIHVPSGRVIGINPNSLMPFTPARLYSPIDPNTFSFYNYAASRILVLSTQVANPYFFQIYFDTFATVVLYEQEDLSVAWTRIGTGGSFENQFFVIEKVTM